jgi:REP element-mobilizing transposase RayT
MKDHVHMLVSIPSKMSVSSFMGYLKGKSALMIFDKHGALTREVAEALIEHVPVYDGGRLEIKWRFSSPTSPEL